MITMIMIIIVVIIIFRKIYNTFRTLILFPSNVSTTSLKKTSELVEIFEEKKILKIVVVIIIITTTTTTTTTTVKHAYPS